jgi:hypothetical protein
LSLPQYLPAQLLAALTEVAEPIGVEVGEISRHPSWPSVAAGAFYGVTHKRKRQLTLGAMFAFRGNPVMVEIGRKSLLTPKRPADLICTNYQITGACDFRPSAPLQYADYRAPGALPDNRPTVYRDAVPQSTA